MEVKQFHCYLLLPLFILIYNINAQHHQYIVTPVTQEFPSQTILYQSLAQPIGGFNKQKIRSFLKDTFSRCEYAQDLLPHTFAHFLEFLHFGTNSEKNFTYAISTIRLFSNRVKSCTYVTPEAIISLLEKLPSFIDKYFVRKQTSLCTEAKDKVKNILYNMFLNKFSFFKNDPDAFFDDLSADVMNGIHDTSFVQNAIEQEQLRQSLLRFLEIVLDKLIWSPLDQEEVWLSIKEISEKLELLAENGTLNYDELDDLYQSLIARFIHFLHIAGSDLHPQVIDMIKHDIAENKLTLFTLEEQEEFITSKIDRIKEALEKVDIKLIAKDHGIIA